VRTPSLLFGGAAHGSASSYRCCSIGDGATATRIALLSVADAAAAGCVGGRKGAPVWVCMDTSGGMDVADEATLGAMTVVRWSVVDGPMAASSARGPAHGRRLSEDDGVGGGLSDCGSSVSTEELDAGISASARSRGSPDGAPSTWPRSSFASAASSSSAASTAATGSGSGSAGVGATGGAPGTLPLPETARTSVAVARRRRPPSTRTFASLPSLASLASLSGGGVGKAAPSAGGSSPSSSGELRLNRPPAAPTAAGGVAGIPTGTLPRQQAAGVAVRAGLLHSLRGLGSLDRHAVVLRPAEDFAAVVVTRGYGPTGAAAAASAAAVLIAAVQRHLRLPPKGGADANGDGSGGVSTQAPQVGESPRSRADEPLLRSVSSTTSAASVSAAVHSAFVDASLAVDVLPGSAASGAAATLAIVRGGHVTVGNVGAITCFLATPPGASSSAGAPHTVHTLSASHTPECPGERTRIVTAGGRIRRGHVLANRGGGAINVTRLLGASALRAGGVSQLPDVTAVPVGRVAGSAGGGVRILVVASDVGGWAGVESGNVTGCLGAAVATAAAKERGGKGRSGDGVRAAAEGIGRLVWGVGGQVDDATVAVLHSRW